MCPCFEIRMMQISLYAWMTCSPERTGCFPVEKTPGNVDEVSRKRHKYIMWLAVSMKCPGSDTSTSCGWLCWWSVQEATQVHHVAGCVDECLGTECKLMLTSLPCHLEPVTDWVILEATYIDYSCLTCAIWKSGWVLVCLFEVLNIQEYNFAS